MKNPTADVLIVGAGPVGLVLALDLARRGIMVRIVDKAAHPARESRALAIHPRTLEVMEQLGVSDDALLHGRIQRGARFMAGDAELAHITFDNLDTPFPYTLVLEQSGTEHLLADRLSRRGIQVERSCELTGLSQDEEGVRADLVGPLGERSSVNAKYLIGCDGARSTVRSALGLTYEGVTADEKYLLADCEVTFGREWPRDELVAFLGDRSRLLFGALADPLWRVIITLSTEDARMPVNEPTLSGLQAIIDQDHPRAGARLRNPVWLSAFKVNTRMVDRFRVGRCFVAGDAAHIHSPSGGQGMNTGMQDAFNLGWKLALALKGFPGVEAMLDSYEFERKPVAASVLRSTRAADFFITGRRSKLFQAVRNSALPLLTSLELVQDKVPRLLSGGEVNYRKSPIVGAHVQGLGEWLEAGMHFPYAGLADVLGIHGRPAPGDLAPDAKGVSLGDGPQRRLYQQFAAELRHHALFFPGSDPSDARIAEIETEIRAIEASRGSIVRPLLVLPSGRKSNVPTLTDHDGEVARRYGATEIESLVVVRPDGYIAFRSVPASVDAVERFVEQRLGRVA